MSRSTLPQVLLFDLDGTLVDSAPDLAGAANEMRLARALPELPLEALRPLCGSGARGMLLGAFGITAEHESYAAMRTEFLQRYEARLLKSTAVFDDVVPVLNWLNANGRPWGIVTNKSLQLAQALVAGLGLLPSAAVLIGGDSTAHTKPHPAPLLEAARRHRVEPDCCAYVGDDPRDIRAAHAAGMQAWAAGWGYLGVDLALAEWGAHAVFTTPGDLLAFLKKLELA